MAESLKSPVDISRRIGAADWLRDHAVVGAALATTGITAASCAWGSDTEPKPLFSGQDTVKVRLIKNGPLPGEALKLNLQSAPVNLNIKFTDCKKPIVEYESKLPDIVEQFGTEQQTTLSSPEDIGVDCDSVSTSLPAKVALDRQPVSLANRSVDLILAPLMGLKKGQNPSLSRTDTGFATYQTTFNRPKPESDLLKVRSLEQLAETRFEDMLRIEKEEVTLRVGFDAVVAE